MKEPAYIVAGGLGRRMKADKPLVAFRGEPLISHVVGVVVGLGLHPVICVQSLSQPVSAWAESEGHRCVVDTPDIGGPAAGLVSGVRDLRTIGGSTALFFGCDMPWLDAELLSETLALAHERGQPALPKLDGYFHPLHAAWTANALESLETLVHSGERRLMRICESLMTVDPIAQSKASVHRWRRSLRSANTPDDLRAE